MIPNQEWKLCVAPKIEDTLKWKEPIWAAPNKPRGKRDKIGEQEIIAILISIKDVLELRVISVKNLSSDNVLLSVKENDKIKRKQSSIQKGNCFKLLGS
jgi:hypothetical protein